MKVGELVMGWPGVTRWVLGGREVVFEGRGWWGGGEEERERGADGGEGAEMEKGMVRGCWCVIVLRWYTTQRYDPLFVGSWRAWRS